MSDKIHTRQIHLLHDSYNWTCPLCPFKAYNEQQKIQHYKKTQTDQGHKINPTRSWIGYTEDLRPTCISSMHLAKELD